MRNRIRLIEMNVKLRFLEEKKALSSHDAEVVGFHLGSIPVRQTVLAAKSQDYAIVQQRFRVFMYLVKCVVWILITESRKQINHYLIHFEKVKNLVIDCLLRQLYVSN